MTGPETWFLLAVGGVLAEAARLGYRALVRRWADPYPEIAARRRCAHALNDPESRLR